MALIYIVEDDINIREIERYALKNSGFEVEEFDNGKDFFQRVAERKNTVALLTVYIIISRKGQPIRYVASGTRDIN